MDKKNSDNSHEICGFCRWLLVRLVHLVLICLLDPKLGISPDSSQWSEVAQIPSMVVDMAPIAPWSLTFFYLLKFVMFHEVVCSSRTQNQRSCYPGLEHMSALRREPRGLLLGPAGRCQSAEVGQKTLSLLMMWMCRVRGSLSLECSWCPGVHWGVFSGSCRFVHQNPLFWAHIFANSQYSSVHLTNRRT